MRVISKETINKSIEKPEDTLILIDKPAEWTSFDVVKKIRNAGKFKKVGHAGTLDPFATGLLILGTGKMTRQLTNLVNEKKSYRTKFTFGKITDTYDKTGKILEDKQISVIDAKKIAEILTKFLGISEQIPPMYSAKKINGVRAYKLARRGEKISRKPHKIIIHEIKINGIEGLDLNLDVTCSKGTYIRSLAYDLGIQTGYGAYVKELRRISINGYSVYNALQIEEFIEYWMSRN